MTIVYTKPACPQCDATLRTLDKLGIDYATENAIKNRDLLGQLGYQQAPVIIAPDGDTWSGYNPERLRALAA